MSRAIKSALHTARRIAKKYADGGNVNDILFDKRLMTPGKTPNQRVREGHQEFEPGYVRGWEYEGAPIMNMRGQQLTMRHAADGGAQRTAAFPEKPEGYEFYGPDDSPGNAPPPAVDVPGVGYVPTDTAPMEPLVRATASVPQGMIDWAKTPGEIARREVPQMPESGELTEEDEYLRRVQQAHQAQQETEFGGETALNMFGFNAPFAPSGAVGVAGARARTPRGQPMTLDRVLTELTPDQINRLSRNQLNALRADASAFWDGVKEAHPNPEQWVADNFPNMAVLEERLSRPDVAPRRQTPAQAPLIDRQLPEIARHLILTYGNDEAAIAGWFDSMKRGGANLLTLNNIFESLPQELQYRIKVHDAYAHETPRAEPKPQYEADAWGEPSNFGEPSGGAPRPEELHGDPITEQEFNQIPYKPPTEAPPVRDYGSLDELEAALRDIVGRPSSLPEPIRRGEPINISTFFERYNRRDVQRLSDSQLEDLSSQLGDHEAMNSSLLSNLENYQPEMLSSLRGRIRERREATGTPDPQTEVTRQALIDRLSRGEPPQRGRPRQGVQLQPQSTNRPPPPSPEERMRAALERFRTAFQEHLGSHFRDEGQFFNDYFAGRHGTDMIATYSPFDGFRFEGTLRNEAGETVGSISRDFDPVHKTAHHGYLRIHEGTRGTGFVPKMLSNQISTYRSLGIERVMLNANIDVGSYAWAKYGWVPDVDGWAYLSRHIKNILQSRYAETPWIRNNYLMEILNNPNPKSIWLLADIETPVSATNNMPIGKALLMNRSWNGTLHLKDEDSVARFNDYVASRIAKAKKEKEKSE